MGWPGCFQDLLHHLLEAEPRRLLPGRELLARRLPCLPPPIWGEVVAGVGRGRRRRFQWPSCGRRAPWRAWEMFTRVPRVPGVALAGTAGTVTLCPAVSWRPPRQGPARSRTSAATP